MKKIFFLFNALLMSVTGFGQEVGNGTIKGRILNAKNNEPVPYANILIQGTMKGTISDAEGNYILTGVTPGYVELKASSVGYKPYISMPMQVTNADPVDFDILLEETQVALEEVTIKSSPFRKDQESPVSLRRISIAEIERNPGANRDISRVIQSFPGVLSTPAYRNDVIVRGGGASENRFYLDGVEIPNLNHFATQGSSGGAVGIINVDLIREVNFYSGAFPADRGNALSSILEMRQIDGNTNHLKFKGSIGASDLAVAVDGPAGKKTTYIASVRRSYLQFLFAGLGLPFLPTYNDFQMKIRTRFNEKNELTFIGLGALDQSQLNLSANKTESQRYILGYLPESDQWNYTFGAVYRHFRENGIDTWVISRNYLNNKSYKYLNNIEADSLKIFDYNSYEAENKFRFEHQYISGSGYKMIYGGNLESGEYFNHTLRYLYTGEKYAYKSTLHLFKWGLFGQVSREFFNDRLSLSLGIRSDASNYSSKTNHMLRQLSPRFSVSYALSSRWSVNGNAGRYFQLPPYTSLGFRNPDGVLVNRNNGITYISADHWVTGIDFYPDSRSKFSVEGFYKLYRNYPLSVSDSVSIASKGADFGSFGDEEILSVSKGEAYGAEVLYQNKNLAGFNLVVSYTWVRSLSGNMQGKLIPTSWDSRSIINITGLRDLGRNWNVGLKWRYVGGTPYTPWDMEKSDLVSAWDAQGRGYPDYSRFNQLRFKPYHQLDLRIDKEYYFKSWSLRFYLDVQNVYNFKADEQAPLVRATGQNGEPLPAQGNPPRYILTTIPTNGGGTVLPTVGVIVQF